MNPTESCNDSCPIARAAHIIETKWTTLIFRELLSGKKRYSELQKNLTDISPKILSQRLKDMVGEGLIQKTIYATIPPTTEYQLTPLGKEFKTVLLAMKTFGDRLIIKDAKQS